MWRGCLCSKRETTTEREEGLGKWGLEKRLSLAFRAGTLTKSKTVWSLVVRDMGKHRNSVFVSLSSSSTWDNPASTLWFAVLQVTSLGEQWLFWARETATEPRPYPVPDHSNILHFLLHTFFQKFLYAFSFGFYTTTVRKIG